MESPQRLKTRRRYLAGTVCALLAIAFAAPSAAVEGRGAATNANGLEASAPAAAALRARIRFLRRSGSAGVLHLALWKNRSRRQVPADDCRGARLPGEQLS